jgi:hypothetical protein
MSAVHATWAKPPEPLGIAVHAEAEVEVRRVVRGVRRRESSVAREVDVRRARVRDEVRRVAVEGRPGDRVEVRIAGRVGETADEQDAEHGERGHRETEVRRTCDRMGSLSSLVGGVTKSSPASFR